MRNIRGIDLELLVTLEALLTECNVTRVARRLHLSQPTVSVRLGKLRRLFDDPLLVSGPRGMQPTRRGLGLLPHLQDALGGVQRMLNTQTPFDPATAVFTWRVAASDNAQYAVLAPTMRRLRRFAPGICVAVHALVPNAVAGLTERGDIDAVLMSADMVPESLRSTKLYTEHYCMLARKGHPRLQGPLTLAAFCQLEHIVVSPEGGGFKGPTDILLEARGRKRRVVLSVPHFLLVPDLVRQSDMVALLPSRLLRGHLQGLQIWEAPVQPPRFDMMMAWHERVHADPAQAWLREQVVNAVSTPR
ncbi:LysR family transcriptional regulator [Dyella flava]|uniref:LysR family transcriptional regulator n=1 Tax=Dyella flava TaxID=1920170 RepID=A0ABS2K0W4_9GAMM|nr:LysR family transcriptional regulator [Dyella flava]MBM7124896.1 LysR family transcriptional regulator [Dyella flava]GLQ49849.1 LysR family transcriptional regulator [Dyella flava]